MTCAVATAAQATCADVPIRLQFASGEAEANAARRRIGGESRLVSPLSQFRLAGIPI